MRATGIVRKVDELGRIVIPKELRRTMSIEEDTPLEIFTDNGQIILRKYEPGCIFCGSIAGIFDLDGKKVCPACIVRLNEKVKKTA